MRWTSPTAPNATTKRDECGACRARACKRACCAVWALLRTARGAFVSLELRRSMSPKKVSGGGDASKFDCDAGKVVSSSAQCEADACVEGTDKDKCCVAACASGFQLAGTLCPQVGAAGER